MEKLWYLIKGNMLKHPQREIRDENNTYSFNDIIQVVEEKARSLSEQKYAILCKSELNAAIWLLAVLAAGKTAIPLSYRYGENHYNKIIDVVNPNSIIHDTEIETYHKETTRYDVECLNDVAFIMCTSGTTGVPKGVMITDENIITNASDIADYFKINDSDEVLISRPLYHCAVLTGEFIVSLIEGANIHFLNENNNIPKIIQYIFSHKITVYCNTPTCFYYICKLAKNSELLHTLKKVAVSGECMTEKASGLMKQCFINADIYNVYGLTEASPRVSYLRPDLFNQNSLSIGRPLRSVKIKIVNSDGEEVGYGIPGELLVNGENVMKGYYRNEEKTNEVLRGGWLHTGDIALKDVDNLLYIKGRKDDMIIKGGMNIYPLEIENVILKDKRIKDVLVYAVKNDLGQRIAVSIIAEGTISKMDVINLCVKELAPYQIPDEINFVDDLIRNASGKKLRRVGHV